MNSQIGQSSDHNHNPLETELATRINLLGRALRWLGLSMTFLSAFLSVELITGGFDAPLSMARFALSCVCGCVFSFSFLLMARLFIKYVIDRGPDVMPTAKFAFSLFRWAAASVKPNGD